MPVTLGVHQLGPELLRRRNERGLSLRDVEKEAKISAATLSRIEQGSVPQLTIMKRLAEWLGVNVSAAGDETQSINSDEDLKRTIAVYLRARRNMPEKTARAIADTFDIVMRLEVEREGGSGRKRGGAR